MDNDLKQQLDWMNTNLNTIAENQAMIYAALAEIKDKLPEPTEKTA